MSARQVCRATRTHHGDDLYKEKRDVDCVVTAAGHVIDEGPGQHHRDDAEHGVDGAILAALPGPQPANHRVSACGLLTLAPLPPADAREVGASLAVQLGIALVEAIPAVAAGRQHAFLVAVEAPLR
eukprot:2216358-Rhodomonas_salina.4